MRGREGGREREREGGREREREGGRERERERESIKLARAHSKREKRVSN